jgi:hypothetical protein
MAAEINSKKIAKLRVILDTEQDVYRDIEIYTDSTLLHFHNAILDSFGWASGEMASLVIGLVFFAMGIGLFFYGRRMLKKTKDIGYLALAGMFFLEQNANACATCFGESDAPMADGMNAGIFTLLIVVGGTLTGIAGFFIFIIRRSMRLASVEFEDESPTV